MLMNLHTPSLKSCFTGFLKAHGCQPSLVGCITTLSLVFFAASASAATAPPLQIAVSAKAVTVSNVPPGDTIVLFSCSRISQSRSIAVRSDTNVLDDADRDGVIQFIPASGIPVRSVWIALDESSGSVATAAAPGFPLLVSSFATDALQKDSQGDNGFLQIDLPRIVLLFMRPHVGAWTASSLDPEQRARNPVVNGKVQLAFTDARTVVGKEKPPKQLNAGDTVVGIDPGHLDVFVLQIEK